MNTVLEYKNHKGNIGIQKKKRNYMLLQLVNTITELVSLMCILMSNQIIIKY